MCINFKIFEGTVLLRGQRPLQEGIYFQLFSLCFQPEYYTLIFIMSECMWKEQVFISPFLSESLSRYGSVQTRTGWVLYGSFILISGLKQAVLWDPVFSSISSKHTCIPFIFWIIHSTKTQGHILSIMMIYIATHHCLGELKSTAHKTWRFFHILIFLNSVR